MAITAMNLKEQSIRDDEFANRLPINVRSALIGEIATFWPQAHELWAVKGAPAADVMQAEDDGLAK